MSEMDNRKQYSQMLIQVRKRHRKNLFRRIKRNWLLYIFLLPAVAYVATFCYAPMYGLQIAFRNFKIRDGITGSEWVGLKWFIRFVNQPRFWKILENTVSLSVYNLIVSFPLPINRLTT